MNAAERSPWSPGMLASSNGMVHPGGIPPQFYRQPAGTQNCRQIMFALSEIWYHICHTGHLGDNRTASQPAAP